jgi:hypothetical protein
MYPPLQKILFTLILGFLDVDFQCVLNFPLCLRGLPVTQAATL